MEPAREVVPKPSSEVLNLVPEKFARNSRVIPIKSEGGTVTVACSDPDDILAQDEVQKFAKCDKVVAVKFSDEAIKAALDSFYGEERINLAETTFG